MRPARAPAPWNLSRRRSPRRSDAAAAAQRLSSEKTTGAVPSGSSASRQAGQRTALGVLGRRQAVHSGGASSETTRTSATLARRAPRLCCRCETIPARDPSPCPLEPHAHGRPAARAVRRDLPVALRAARREEGGRGAAAAAPCFAVALAALTRRGRLADRRPGRGLPVLHAHAPAHPAGRHRTAVFLLLALSRVIMRPATRRLIAVERALGRFAHPLTGLVLWLGLIYFWHIPALYDAALESDVVHALEHASFFTAGLALWWPLIQPVPMRQRMTGLCAVRLHRRGEGRARGARPLPDLVARPSPTTTTRRSRGSGASPRSRTRTSAAR